MNEINLLGLKVTDKVTGQVGIVTSICYDLYGCVQAIINPGKGADGKLGECMWFDVSRLHIEKGPRVLPLPSFGQPMNDDPWEPTSVLTKSAKGPESKPVPR